MTASGTVVRTTIANSWSWMRLDLLLRLLPLTIVPLIFSWLSGTPLSSLGLVFTHPFRDVLVAVPLGLAGFAIAAGFGAYLSHRSGRRAPCLFVTPQAFCRKWRVTRPSRLPRAKAASA